ncbi:hypothetical protein ACXKGW_28950 [Klebsiella pneumoniae subsp. pneumoniae]
MLNCLWQSGRHLDASWKRWQGRSRRTGLSARRFCWRAFRSHDTRARDAIQSEHESHAEAVAREEEWRQIGLGAQILKDLGITSIVLLASRERHYVGLEGFGIHIARTEII